ncbi:hypothetical protein Tco_0092599 [Tanacetum coccineum]
MEEEQNQPEVMQELLLKLMNDLQIFKGIQQEKKEPAAQSFTPYWDFSMIFMIEEAENKLYERLLHLLRGSFSLYLLEVTPKDSSTFDALSDHSEILSDSNNDGTSSDDNDFEDIEYVDESPPDSELIILKRRSSDKNHYSMFDIFQYEFVQSFDLSIDSFPPADRRYPDFEDSRAHGFVHSYIRASNPQLHLGNPIS